MNRARMTVAMVALALLAPASAEAAGTVSVVASAVDNPRHLALSADGATLYVASAGHAGPTCLDKKKTTCVGFSSSVLGVDVATGAKTTLAGGLLSIGGRDGSFTVGADGVSVGPDGRVDTIITSGTEAQVTHGPKKLQAQAGRVLQVLPTPMTALGRVDTFEFANNSDKAKGKGARESDPYGILALDGHDVVADAAANSIIDLRGGTASLLAVIPRIGRGQSVPTSLAVGPDGAVYVGTLAEGAGNQGAKVFRVPPEGGDATVYQSGFTAITGIAFGPDGSLFVTQLTKDVKKFPPNGDVVRVAPDGTRTALGDGTLHFPAGAAVAPDGTLYVSNLSVAPAKTPKKSPFKGAGGQVVKITGF